MSEVDSSQSTTTESTQSVVVETPAPQSVAPAEGQTTPSQPSGEQAPPVFTPNWKFKAAGKEHEIPEYLRGVVKDAETEKKLKELHEKAYGLDLVKNNYQNAQQQIQQFQKTLIPEHQKLKKTVEHVVMCRNNGDLDSVFESIGLQPQAVAKWLYDKIEMQQMSPEQRAAFAQAQEYRRQNYALQEQVKSLSGSQEQQVLQAKSTELQTALAKPEVQTVADSYNARMGQPDAFWNFVCQQADFLERTTGQNVTADQAIQQVIRVLGTSIVPQAQPASAPASPQSKGSPTPPVIPHIGGARNTSPTRKQARSIDDLRKLAKEMSDSA